jgi:16S rRNA (guanine527-N7)-methyltransferase
VDSIGKKISVVKGVCETVGIENLTAINGRVESVNEKFDYVVSRAVTDMATFVGWVWNKIARGEGKGTLPNGILYLKGGDLDAELAATKLKWQQINISEFFEEEFFETKKVVYTTR